MRQLVSGEKFIAGTDPVKDTAKSGDFDCNRQGKYLKVKKGIFAHDG